MQPRQSPPSEWSLSGWPSDCHGYRFGDVTQESAMLWKALLVAAVLAGPGSAQTIVPTPLAPGTTSEQPKTEEVEKSVVEKLEEAGYDNIVLKPDPAGFYTATATKEGKRVNLIIDSTGGVLER
jgi:hypothetical protein